MICETCKSLGLNSTISVGPIFTTLMASYSFYDENGEYHHHDPNKIITSLRCSNGHSFETSKTTPCPTCSKKEAVPACTVCQ
jgi:hypothetical protein